MENKKGVSTVVATILIILLSVVAVVVVAGFVVPFVKNNLEESTECVDYSDYFYFEEEFGLNCYTTQENGGEFDKRTYAFSVGSKGNKKELENGVKGFRVSMIRQGNAKSIYIENGAEVTEEIKMKDGTGNFELPRIGEVRTYIYVTRDENDLFSSLEIYPVLKNDKTCDRSDKISIAGELCENEI